MSNPFYDLEGRLRKGRIKHFGDSSLITLRPRKEDFYFTIFLKYNLKDQEKVEYHLPKGNKIDREFVYDGLREILKDSSLKIIASKVYKKGEKVHTDILSAPSFLTYLSERHRQSES